MKIRKINKMKRVRDSQKSKNDILQAAEQLFAEKGLYGARIDEIAKQANINKRMIYEYFGNKDELYKSVLLHVYKHMQEAEEGLLSQKLSGIELIREVINLYFDFLHENPNFVSILLWENLNKAEYLNKLDEKKLERPAFKYLKDEIKKARESGIFKPNIDENQVVISLITMCFSNFSNSYTLSKLFKYKLYDDSAMAIRKQHTMDIMITYLCK